MEIMHARIDSSTRSNDLYLKEMPVIAKFKKAEFIIGKKASLDDNDFYIELSKEYFKKMDIQKHGYIIKVEINIIQNIGMILMHQSQHQ